MPKRNDDIALCSLRGGHQIRQVQDHELAELYSSRAYTRSKLGKVDNSFADYTDAIQIDPKYVVAYNNRCAAYFSKGDFELARGIQSGN